jgi:sporulation protein YlmC with PRC-barrel domain
MLASDIKDIVVYSKDMINLGKVKDLEFDPSEMKVTNIIVEFEKDAAKEVLGKMLVLRHATGRVPTTSVESIKDALNLKSSLSELKGAFKGL